MDRVLPIHAPLAEIIQDELKMGLVGAYELRREYTFLGE
jgi:hypothetical protein